MRDIRRRIKREFWTSGQTLKSAWKMKRLMEPVGFSSIAWHWLWWELTGSPDPWGNRRRKDIPESGELGAYRT